MSASRDAALLRKIDELEKRVEQLERALEAVASAFAASQLDKIE